MDGAPPVYDAPQMGAPPAAPAAAYTPSGAGAGATPGGATPGSAAAPAPDAAPAPAVVRGMAAFEYVTQAQLTAVRVATGAAAFVLVMSIVGFGLKFAFWTWQVGNGGALALLYNDGVRRMTGGVLATAFGAAGSSGSAALGRWRPTALGLGAAVSGMLFGAALVDVIEVVRYSVMFNFGSSVAFSAVQAAVSVLAHGALTWTSLATLVSGCSTVASSNVAARERARATATARNGGGGGALLDPVEQQQAAADSADAQAEPHRRTAATHCVTAKHLKQVRVAGGVLLAFAVFRFFAAAASITLTVLFDDQLIWSGHLMFSIYAVFMGRWMLRDCFVLGVLGLALLHGAKRYGRHAYRPSMVGFAFGLGSIVLGAQCTDGVAGLSGTILSPYDIVSNIQLASQPLNVLVLGLALLPVFIVLSNGARRPRAA